jgi:hypothetical protein
MNPVGGEALNSVCMGDSVKSAKKKLRTAWRRPECVKAGFAATAA